MFSVLFYELKGKNGWFYLLSSLEVFGQLLVSVFLTINQPQRSLAEQEWGISPIIPHERAALCPQLGWAWMGCDLCQGGFEDQDISVAQPVGLCLGKKTLWWQPGGIVRAPLRVCRRGNGKWKWKFPVGAAQGSDLGDNTQQLFPKGDFNHPEPKSCKARGFPCCVCAWKSNWAVDFSSAAVWVTLCLLVNIFERFLTIKIDSCCLVANLRGSCVESKVSKWGFFL